MVQPGLPRFAKAVFNHHLSRGLSSSSRSSPISVARLLDSSPTDPSNVVVNGFIVSIRNHTNRSFASLGDGSSCEPLQALLTPQQGQSLRNGTAVRLTGTWEPSPTKGQTHELHVRSVDILGPSDAHTYPLQKKYQTREYLRTIPHVRSRTDFNSILLRLRSQSIAKLTQFFAERDFTQTHTPIITSSDCEGAGEVFNISTGNNTADNRGGDEAFFRSTKYLTVSSQLHLEALAQSIGKVWTLSPTFRAEKSDTARHLSEFYMLEAEMNFVEQIDDVMNLVEDMLRYITKGLYETQVGRELLSHKRRGASETEELSSPSKALECRWQGMMDGPWPRISYTEAVSLLQSSQQKFEHSAEWGLGLQAEHERYIATTVGKGKPVFVTAYPKAIKPFYMLPSPNSTSTEPQSQETVECFDLLVPEICEIVGGSLREHRFPQLIEAMREHGLMPMQGSATASQEDLGNLSWYSDLRRWGCAPHGGFGLGFDRLLAYLSGLPNIREVVTFPRWVGRCDC